MRRRARSRRLKVAVLSYHPLALERITALLEAAVPKNRRGPRFDVRAHRLDPARMFDAPALDRRGPTFQGAAVCVMDAQAPWPATETLAAALLDRFPAARLVVVSERFSEAQSFALLRLGVKGLLPYAQARGRLREAVAVVAGGGFWVERRLLSRFVDVMLVPTRARRTARPLGAAGLSGREREVLDGLLDNLSNKEIASRLHIAERTVKFHVSKLLEKFGVADRSELLLHCLQARPASSRFPV